MGIYVLFGDVPSYLWEHGPIGLLQALFNLDALAECWIPLALFAAIGFLVGVGGSCIRVRWDAVW